MELALSCFPTRRDLRPVFAEMRRPYSPGANDNAASVAVNLRLATQLAREPLEATEVWCAFTGAEEVDHRGLKVLLKEHPELRDALFIDLEGVGGGKLCYLTQEGILRHYNPDPGLLRFAEEAAKRRPEKIHRPTLSPTGTPARTRWSMSPLPHSGIRQNSSGRCSMGSITNAEKDLTKRIKAYLDSA